MQSSSIMSFSSSPKCVLDTTIVNEVTLSDMTDIGLSFFAPLCGRNRGVFVLDPTDGHTWSCTSFPPNLAQLAGLSKHNRTAHLVPEQATDIVKYYVKGNITATEVVAYLDFLTQRVYESSASVTQDPYACNVQGLSKLTCPAPTTLPTVIRAVATAGLFVPAPWATAGKTRLTHRERQAFYTAQDFMDMAKAGLNTVLIPFPLSAFAESDTESTGDNNELVRELSHILMYVQDAQLQAILVLDAPPLSQQELDSTTTQAIQAAVAYGTSLKHENVVFALSLPFPQALTTARQAHDTVKLLIPANQGDLRTITVPDENVMVALDMSHTGSIGDVASSTSLDDRMKMFYHESMACVARSPLEFAKCHRDLSVLVATGFDLAIDDCMMRGTSHFVDYGQCDRWNETTHSHWWQRHRQSFAARQLFAYEQGSAGWTFATWKLYGTDPDNIGVLDDFAKLLSFSDVAAAGLLPTPFSKSSTRAIMTEACLNPPVADFQMGDQTYAPTSAPVDCGNGWWNETTQNCTYWIPPVTMTPTASPVMENLPGPTFQTSTSLSSRPPISSVIVGTLAGLVVGLVLGKYVCRPRREGYTEIPSHESNLRPV